MDTDEVHGLRTAKRLTRKQVAAVKGERGEFARGYRRAINDLVEVIGKEIDAARMEQMTEEIRQKNDAWARKGWNITEQAESLRQVLLKPGLSVDDLAAEISARKLQDGLEGRELSDAERLGLDKVFRRTVETDENLQRLLNADLADHVKTQRWP